MRCQLQLKTAHFRPARTNGIKISPLHDRLSRAVRRERSERSAARAAITFAPRRVDLLVGAAAGMRVLAVMLAVSYRIEAWFVWRYPKQF